MQPQRITFEPKENLRHQRLGLAGCKANSNSIHVSDYWTIYLGCIMKNQMNDFVPNIPWLFLITDVCFLSEVLVK